MSARAAVILAAGQGTRMKSPLPKVLHRLAGRAMLDHAIDAAEALGCERIVVVVGAHAPEVREHVVRRLGETSVAVQEEPLGTAHAVRAAEPALKDFPGKAVGTYADCPPLEASDIAPVIEGAHAASVRGFDARDPGASGGLVRGAGDELLRHIGAREAGPAVLAIRLCISGVTAAEASLLFSLLADVTNDHAKGEYYLTDIVELA